MRFLVDMPLSPMLAQWLVDEGLDAVHASIIGMGQALDTAIIERATRGVRTAITADLDYPRLLALIGAREPSLILFRGGNWSDAGVISRMRELLGGLSQSDIAQSLLVVDRERVRRRRLPLTKPE